MTNAMAVGGIDQNTAERQMTGGCQDFLNARFQARLSTVISFLIGRQNTLASLGNRLEQSQSKSESYIGVQTIPISSIVGSECRSADFDRRFMPRKGFLLHRWLNVNQAYHQGTQLPAIKVFEIGGSYFVRDGNHRVSVARYHRVGYIDAEVVRIAS
jgi:hypothetical protein